VAAIGTAAREDNWKIFGCSTPVFKCTLGDAKATAEHREIFKRSLDVARTLKCDLLRIFTFLREPNPLDPKRLDQIAEELAKVVDLAKGSGVRIGLENEHSCMTATVEEMEAILSRVKAPNVGAIWDPCNVLYVPGATAPNPDNLQRLGARLFHVHLKDAIRKPRASGEELIATGTPVGIGEIGWRAHLTKLKQLGYAGMLSLETHWRLHEVDEKSLHLPGGYGFSAGGEAASRVCFHNLKVLVETS
jgi:sugar phosphate isomerase/epimerase